MSEPDVREWMRADWNARAKEDANYYVAFGRRGQGFEEFVSTGADVVRSLVAELKRLPASRAKRARRALEIGCGPGRLMLPLIVHFGEIHGVDVSDEMISRARQNLKGIPHAHLHVGSGSELSQFADESFDLVYSYAVFQHIPAHEVIWSYLREAVRVVRPLGLVRCQVNGLRKGASEKSDTWSGASFTGVMLREFARAYGLQLLALEGEGTQYLWMTLRKPGMAPAPSGPPAIVRVTNAESSEPCAPAGGRYAAIAVLVEGLPEEADLNSLEVRVRGAACTTTYIGPPAQDGLVQVNAVLPSGLGTGLAPVELWWNGVPLAAGGMVRIVPTPPMVPRLVSVTDGVDIVSGSQIVSGVVKVILEDVVDLGGFEGRVNGSPVRDVETFLTMPQVPRWEVNFHLPDGTAPGPATLELVVARRNLGSFQIAVG